MKFFARSFFGTLGVACWLLQFSSSSARAQQIKVMQWNVHGNLGTATAQAGVEAAAIARILNYLQPDVLLLNEVADGDAATNTGALTQWISANLQYLAGGSFSVAVSTEPSNTQRNAVVSRYPILSPFTYPDVSSGLRGLFSFDLQLAGTNRLHIFHVHLKCCSDAASCQTKQDEAQLFTNNIATWAATNSTPYLLAGDLNEDEANPECPGYPTISTLRNGAQLGEFMPTTLSGEYRTWSTAPTTPSIRFDYILAATNRLSPDSGFVFSTMDWAAHGLYTNASAPNLANDSQTASDHYGVVATFNFGAQLSVSPPTGLTATGTLGGPFTPASQTYTLMNLGGATLTWTASVSSNWLTVSAAGGTLAAGAGTSVTISINTNANNFPAGNYSDTLSFMNTASGAGIATRAVSLTVNIRGAQLAVSPAGGFSSAGPPGGAFNPASQSYTLSNPGSAPLNWTASNSANWLSVSPAGGTLAAGTSTNLTVAITPNANALTAGTYSDTVSITNTTTGTGSTTRPVTLNVSSFGFFDDFSLFAPGNLVGQQSWVQALTAASLPLQVGGGQVVIPFGQAVDNQDAYKNFTATNRTIFYGLALTITNAPVSSAPSYFAALYTSNNAAGFANYRLTAKDNGGGACVLGLRITGQAGNPYSFGTGNLSYGVPQRVIVEADTGGTVMKLFVNPTGANLAAQTLYASNSINSGTPPTQVGSFVISQFASGAAPNAGVAIGKVVVADNFATVYNALTPALTPFQTWQVQYFGTTNSPSADPGADPDGDGMSNLAEFFAGTNPTNSASALRILGVTQENNYRRVTWSTARGRTNVLQAVATLTDTFTNVSPNLILTGSGDTVTNYLDPVALSASAARFYRVYLVP